MDVRQQSLQNWVLETLSSQYQPQGSLEVVSGDASFRRYFRQNVLSDGNASSLIAVDAPPEHEDNPSFVKIAKAWFEQGINVPEVLAVDFDHGFMLLSDLGDQLLLPLLNDDTADELYGLAMEALIPIQNSKCDLPPYDEALLDREMALFRDWLLVRHLGMELTQHDESILTETFDMLRESALGQVQVPVHRDYHSRNLMMVNEGASQSSAKKLGIIDFQDAVHGPITYDLVSLLKDCYMAWPKDKVVTWAQQYFAKARAAGLVAVSQEQFMLWFDWMGMQRHLKASGIFARLNHRDGKDGYMEDIPRTLNYIRDVSAQYQALQPFNSWFEARLAPVLEANDMAMPEPLTSESEAQEESQL